MAWAYATAKHADPALFAAIASTAARQVEAFAPQDHANLCWAFATAGEPAPALFAAVSKSLEATPSKFAAFKPQNLASLAWSFSKAGVRAPGLFAEIAAAATNNIDAFAARHLAKTAWAFSVAEEVEAPELFAAIAEAARNKVASPDARYRLHRAALAGCRLRNDESRAAQLQKQIHAEGLEALRPAATVRGRMVPFANGREPSNELDALFALLGDKYEPHLRALPYAFAGDAAAGARSLKYHAEKKALAHLLADDAAELRVDVNFKMCADCHGFFKAASAVVDRPIHVSEGGRPAHTFRRGQCSCGDACSLGVWKSKLYARVTTDWSIFIQVALGGAAAARRRPHGGGARLARRRVRARRGAHGRARVAAHPPARGGRRGAPPYRGRACVARRGVSARRAADGRTKAGRRRTWRGPAPGGSPRRPRPQGSPGLISDCMKLARALRLERATLGPARANPRARKQSVDIHAVASA